MQFLIGSLFGSKCDLLGLLLEKGMVMVHLDARCEGVDVPQGHRNDHHLRLNLSTNFDIDDFTYTPAEGVRASLSFRGQRHYCVLPWHAIFAITSHIEPIGYLWPEDLPPELATRLNASAPGMAAGTDRGVEPLERGGWQRPGLRLVHGGSDAPAIEPPEVHSEVVRRRSSGGVPSGSLEAEENETSHEGRRYGHLRVVK